ncbi:MAG: Mut7-C RNAse domain-containing protein [Candidatus Bathyarchaeota archaeon]|nr:MAG: Mut7-C RNAse domain-containing protein [Candidatus Bathyarchaeota archaeon]
MRTAFMCVPPSQKTICNSKMVENRLKFVTDGMLGKLTRWLRMLGHNVKYAKNLDDKTIIKIAKSEKRTLLTRDADLYQQATNQHASTFFIERKDKVECLASLSKRFGLKLEINPDISRCPKCNAKIKQVKKPEVSQKILPSTKAHYEEFWQCGRCGKIYWQGAHWKRISETLRKAERVMQE